MGSSGSSSYYMQTESNSYPKSFLLKLILGSPFLKGTESDFPTATLQSMTLKVVF